MLQRSDEPPAAIPVPCRCFWQALFCCMEGSYCQPGGAPQGSGEDQGELWRGEEKGNHLISGEWHRGRWVQQEAKVLRGEMRLLTAGRTLTCTLLLAAVCSQDQTTAFKENNPLVQGR